MGNKGDGSAPATLMLQALSRAVLSDKVQTHSPAYF